jgi:hypothetical protein
VPHVAAAVLGACGVELSAAKALRRKLIWPSSALLSGMIVAFVLGTGQSWWGAGADVPWPFLVLLIAGGAVVHAHRSADVTVAHGRPGLDRGAGGGSGVYQPAAWRGTELPADRHVGGQRGSRSEARAFKATS